MHPFVESSIAALAKDARLLTKKLEEGDAAEARRLSRSITVRLEGLERFEIRLLSEARKAERE